MKEDPGRPFESDGSMLNSAEQSVRFQPPLSQIVGSSPSIDRHELEFGNIVIETDVAHLLFVTQPAFGLKLDESFALSDVGGRQEEVRRSVGEHGHRLRKETGVMLIVALSFFNKVRV